MDSKIIKIILIIIAFIFISTFLYLQSDYYQEKPKYVDTVVLNKTITSMVNNF